jgi:hypothetical protein
MIKKAWDQLTHEPGLTLTHELGDMPLCSSWRAGSAMKVAGGWDELRMCEFVVGGFCF